MPNPATKSCQNGKVTAKGAPKSAEAKGNGTKMHRRSRSGLLGLAKYLEGFTDDDLQAVSPAGFEGRSVMKDRVSAKLVGIWG